MDLISIGRDSTNRIVIPDNSNKISRNHGTLKVFDNGSMSYSDHSTNGTWVNGNLVRNSEVQVVRGARIVFPNNVELNWSKISFGSNANNVQNQFSKNNGLADSKVDMFMMSNGKFFESHQLGMIRERLSTLDESKWALVSNIQFKNSNTILIISILVGSLGIDRFMIGDTALGLGKLLTCGGFYVWTIIDWFMIQKATKERNLQKLQQFMY
jgi:pSer/pThr/pTyr-binding forkhead associated (FHA) protein